MLRTESEDLRDRVEELSRRNTTDDVCMYRACHKIFNTHVQIDIHLSETLYGRRSASLDSIIEEP